MISKLPSFEAILSDKKANREFWDQSVSESIRRIRLYETIANSWANYPQTWNRYLGYAQKERRELASKWRQRRNYEFLEAEL